MREEVQTRLGCRDGEVIPHHMDMDLDNNMVHEQLEDYEGSEHGDTLGRKEVDNKHGGYGTDVTEGPHEVTGRTTPGADDKGASAMDNDDGRTGHGRDNVLFDEGPSDSKSSGQASIGADAGAGFGNGIAHWRQGRNAWDDGGSQGVQ